MVRWSDTIVPQPLEAVDQGGETQVTKKSLIKKFTIALR